MAQEQDIVGIELDDLMIREDDEPFPLTCYSLDDVLDLQENVKLAAGWKLVECECDVQGRGLLHAVGHHLDVTEREVLQDLHKEAKRMKDAFTKWYSEYFAARDMTVDDFIASLDYETTNGWAEDHVLVRLICLTYVRHICIFYPSGTWSSAHSGSAKMCTIFLVQVFDEGDVMFEPVVGPKDTMVFNGEECQADAIKVALVQETILQMANGIVTGDFVQDLLMSNPSFGFLSPVARERESCESVPNIKQEPVEVLPDSAQVLLGGKVLELYPYVCSRCKKSYKTIGALRSHFKKCHPDFPHVCRVGDCTKLFSLKPSLHRHFRGAHKGEKNFECDSCQKGFLQHNELVRHESSHKPESVDRSFECEVESCEKKYPTKAALTRHASGHKGPYPCMFCKKVFKTQASGKQHVLTKHSMGGLSFRCKECEKIFSSKLRYRTHKCLPVKK